ncbi:NTP transferase domain-containing protein [Rhizobium oryzicola]|uniref:NTP transferase domain-containing protein n=1 Tax=Rhizobium oryzicola TaxID=1232668 RepID=A0ABT8ST16_9HYPH|nr:NTP transferase domain-containing protein [Rhizobium oryzicola]MDO1581018.1 NTP transferase domain-containing protein [Rhizobium oryzicola]
MSIVKHAVIAAAGLGSRLGQGKPKCLVEIEGVKIIKHILKQLDQVEDVRVIVGFEEKAVIAELKQLGRDVIVVRNPSFRSTTTLHSYTMGCQHLTGDCLFMDGDLLLEPESFTAFLASLEAGVPKLALTKTKTKDAVFAIMEEERIVGFRRQEPTEFEWSNIAWLPVDTFSTIGNTAVYEHLMQFLPIAGHEIISYEIDTSEDMALALSNTDLFGLKKLAG